jgi:hypothetical protein
MRRLANKKLIAVNREFDKSEKPLIVIYILTRAESPLSRSRNFRIENKVNELTRGAMVEQMTSALLS